MKIGLIIILYPQNYGVRGLMEAGTMRKMRNSGDLLQ